MISGRSAGLAAISGANRTAMPDAAVTTISGGATGRATPARTRWRTNRDGAHSASIDIDVNASPHGAGPAPGQPAPADTIHTVRAIGIGS